MKAGFSENLLKLYHTTQCHILENTPLFRWVRKELDRQTEISNRVTKV